MTIIKQKKRTISALTFIAILFAILTLTAGALFTSNGLPDRTNAAPLPSYHLDFWQDGGELRLAYFSVSNNKSSYLVIWYEDEINPSELVFDSNAGTWNITPSDVNFFIVVDGYYDGGVMTVLMNLGRTQNMSYNGAWITAAGWDGTTPLPAGNYTAMMLERVGGYKSAPVTVNFDPMLEWAGIIEEFSTSVINNVLVTDVALNPDLFGLEISTATVGMRQGRHDSNTFAMFWSDPIATPTQETNWSMQGGGTFRLGWYTVGLQFVYESNAVLILHHVYYSIDLDLWHFNSAANTTDIVSTFFTESTELSPHMTGTAGIIPGRANEADVWLEIAGPIFQQYQIMNGTIEWAEDFGVVLAENTFYTVYWLIDTAINLDGASGVQFVLFEHVFFGPGFPFPAEPDVPGWEFVGWYLDEYFTEAFTDEKITDTSLVLYAKMIPIVYNITYVLGIGGVNHRNNPTTYTIITPTITLYAPTRIGYTFVGWAEGNTITEGSIGDRTFTAQWETQIVTVVIMLNGVVFSEFYAPWGTRLHDLPQAVAALQELERMGYWLSGDIMIVGDITLNAEEYTASRNFARWSRDFWYVYVIGALALLVFFTIMFVVVKKASR